MIATPIGATHYKFISGAAAIDFEALVYTTNSHESDILPLTNAPTAIIDLISALPAASTHPLFLLFGIEFYQCINSLMYPLRNGAFNALSIVKVSGI